MSSQTQTLSSSGWMHKPEATAAASEGRVPPMKAVLDEFVGRIRANPKVWAVYASQEGSVIQVWTYVNSTERKDRSAVYEAEWHLLNHYPEIMFDFNVLLRPAGSEEFETDGTDYVYIR